MTLQEPFFQRYQSDDPLVLAKKVEQDNEQLAQARVAHNEPMQLELLSRLGSRLTILGKESAAVPLLENKMDGGESRQDVCLLPSTPATVFYAVCVVPAPSTSC